MIVMMYSTNARFLERFEQIEPKDGVDMFKPKDTINKVRINGITYKMNNPVISVYLDDNRIRINSLGHLDGNNSYFHLVFDEDSFVCLAMEIAPDGAIDLALSA